jgi:HSP20 family molecular chaperone IbpA
MAFPSVIDEINRLFDELIRRPWGAAPRQLSPAAIRDVDDGWIVEIPVEGMGAEDLKVEVHGRRLTVLGRRRSEHERRYGAAGWTRSQQEHTLRQTVTLPAEADPEDLEVRIEGAHLTVHVRRRTP